MSKNEKKLFFVFVYETIFILTGKPISQAIVLNLKTGSFMAFDSAKHLFGVTGGFNQIVSL